METDNKITRIRNGMQIDGKTKTVGAVSVNIILQDSDEKVLFCSGLSLSTGAGFAKGCLFIKTDAADGTKGLYENQGTTAVASFNKIGDITGAEIADDAIVTAKIADDNVTSDKVEPSLIKFADVSLTVAEIKALMGTNIELVPATEAGAGFAIIPIAASLKFTAGTEVLTESDDNLALVYHGSNEVMEIEATGFIDQATDQNRYQEMAEAVRTPEENLAIDLDNNGNGEIAGNASDDCALDIRVYYRVVPVL